MDSDLQIDPQELARNLAITLGTQPPYERLGGLRAPQGPQMAAPGPTAMPDTHQAPNLAITTPNVKGPSQIDLLQNKRDKMVHEGAGEDQIYGKVTGSQFGQHHQILGKILGGLGGGIAKAGDIGLSAVAPALAINLPGTEYHHQMELNHINKQIGTEQGEEAKNASTQAMQAQVPLRQAQAAAAGENADTKQQLATDKNSAEIGKNSTALRKLGLNPDGSPIPREQLTAQEQEHMDQMQSVETLNQAKADLAKAQASGEPEKIKLAQQRMDEARSLAQQRLGMEAQNLQLRTEAQGQKTALATNKATQPLQTVIDKVADAHQAANDKTGPSDYSIIMDFVDSTRPSSGFRFTNTELQLIKHARSLAQDAEGIWNKASQGRILTDEQVAQMLSVMDRTAGHAKEQMDRLSNGGGPQPQHTQPNTPHGTPPQGATNEVYVGGKLAGYTVNNKFVPLEKK